MAAHQPLRSHQTEATLKARKRIQATHLSSGVAALPSLQLATNRFPLASTFAVIN